ncbi:MAG TPA: hypothetical protein RMH99_16240, partial [Sandaracinaceae bacterium LLY-WYZ-13_1]|nr:hypothetical protein [Sandaracinaceae bacterium LLY-WYZ-13_1]
PPGGGGPASGDLPKTMVLSSDQWSPGGAGGAIGGPSGAMGGPGGAMGGPGGPSGAAGWGAPGSQPGAGAPLGYGAPPAGPIGAAAPVAGPKKNQTLLLFGIGLGAVLLVGGCVGAGLLFWLVGVM